MGFGASLSTVISLDLRYCSTYYNLIKQIHLPLSLKTLVIQQNNDQGDSRNDNPDAAKRKEIDTQEILKAIKR